MHLTEVSMSILNVLGNGENLDGELELRLEVFLGSSFSQITCCDSP